MTTEIMKSFGALQAELEKAKDNLKGVDEHIKKLIGRDPSEPQPRPGMKRLPVNQVEEIRGRGRGYPLIRGRRDLGGYQEEDDAPPAKRRPGDLRTVFSRLSGPPRSKRGETPEDDEFPNKPAISSRVIATPKELPSRQEAMAAQNNDERSKARNKRMFGALLGTLQKFRQEETRMKDKEEKRLKVEKKLEENAKREKEELKKERQELFLERKRKQAEIRKIELKMLRIKEQDEWEAKHRHLLNFIQTRAKPHIFYLPKSHNSKTEERLVGSQKVVAKMIEKKREEIRLELDAIEKRGRWRQGLGEPEKDTGHDPSDDEQHMDGIEVGDKENRLESADDATLDSVVKSVLMVPGSGKEGENSKESVGGDNADSEERNSDDESRSQHTEVKSIGEGDEERPQASPSNKENNSPQSELDESTEVPVIATETSNSFLDKHDEPIVKQEHSIVKQEHSDE